MRFESALEAKQNALRILQRELSPVVAARMSVSASAASAPRDVRPVVAVGISAKGSRYRLAIRVQERALVDSALVDAVVNSAKGEAEVLYIGKVGKSASPTWLQSRRRPLCIGVSIGHPDVTAGTLACFVRRPGDAELGLLSNNHVIADENNAEIGDPILQPGKADNGKKKDAVATLAAFTKIKKTKPNLADCAWATINPNIEVDTRKVKGAGKLSTPVPRDPEIDMEVLKLGRTTGLTRGVITAIAVDQLMVGFEFGPAQFDGQVEIQTIEDNPFSQGGDSGSMIMSQDNEPVALLFAGSDSGGDTGYGITYASPMATVLSNLKVEIVV